MSADNILEVNNLNVFFSTDKGRVQALDNISFQIGKGEVVGLVGESGCGKSVTAESILRLLDEKKTSYVGEIKYKGKNIPSLSEAELRHIRGNEISMVFQDPMSSLNPVYTIGDQLMESILLHQKLSKKEAREKAIQMLRLTGIPAPERRLHEYPHQLSGGMRQRAMIAIALACEPDLLIADEPTTALDVTTQAQVLELIQELKDRINMGVIFITHDMGVVAELCSRVIVMYLGQVIEEADVDSIFERPLHPYTQGLMRSIPELDGDRSKKLYVIPGKVPSLHNVPKGCRFADRCEFATDLCREQEPEISAYSDTHKVKCWHYREIAERGQGEL